MNSHLEQNLRLIAESLDFQAGGTFTFAGSPSAFWMSPLPANGTTAASLSSKLHPTVEALQNVLYAACYTREFKGTIEQAAIPANISDDGWINSLSAANSSRERWEEGWQITQFLPSGEIYAQKGAVQRAFWPGEFVRRGDYGLAPQQGTPIAVFLPREARNSQPGFYFAFGENPGSAEEETPIVRFYWNVNRDGAAPLTKKLSSTLNRYQVPFRFKIVNSPALLNRCDTAVLYVGRRYYRIAAELAFETRAAVEHGIEPEVPLFTRRLTDGLAFAEDPGNQESFGMSRCRLLAEGFWFAFSEGRSSVDDRLARVGQHFAASGTSLERPYLNVASIESYEFPQ